MHPPSLGIDVSQVHVYNYRSAFMPFILRWLYLNFRYRVCPLPTNPAMLEKLARDLQISLAFTSRAYGIDSALAQQRIRERLNSFRWSAPLVIAVLCFSLLVSVIISSCFPSVWHET